jgi:hypothetical protein
MSEQVGRSPLPPKSERAALAGAAPISQVILEVSPAENSLLASELQAQKIQRLFCLCRETAITIATLIIARGPR